MDAWSSSRTTGRSRRQVLDSIVRDPLGSRQEQRLMRLRVRHEKPYNAHRVLVTMWCRRQNPDACGRRPLSWCGNIHKREVRILGHAMRDKAVFVVAGVVKCTD